MNPVLNRNLFFVKEHTGIFKASNNYDILDPKTRETILLCREPNLGIFTKLFRFSKYKTNTPFDILITDLQGLNVLRIKRGVTIFRSVVDVYNHDDELIGRFRQRMLSFGGKFEVQNPEGEVLCMLKGKWTSWEFKFSREDEELAKVSKKWAGLGKELFTTADNYMLEINENVPENAPVRKLILAAVMCIDMVLKEN